MRVLITWLVFFLGTSAVAQQVLPVHVLSISAGPSGSNVDGVFTLTEERSVFSRTTDREVVVLFRWRDRPGVHRLVAQWRSPDGAASATSAIDYEAREERFGAYWSLPLARTQPLGTWTIEVTMDGRPAGRFTFEVVDDEIAAPVTMRRLTEAELYERLNSVFVLLHRESSDGRELEGAAGFLADRDGLIYTVLPALDGADSVRATMPDGSSHAISQLAGSNRQQQWAVLRGPALDPTFVPTIASGAVAIGSRCFSMEGRAAIRVLTAGTISGQARSAADDLVLIATFPRAFGMPGAPVIDEYGHIIGIVGAGLPGDSRPVDHIVQARGDLNGAPIINFPTRDGEHGMVEMDLASLRASGRLMSAVAHGGSFAGGGFTRGLVKRADSAPAELMSQFSLRDKSIGVFLVWTVAERLRGQVVLRVFDSENGIISASEPRRMDIRPKQYARTTWELPRLHTPGLYRVDAVVDERTYWRGFLTVLP
jgi:S1-C subfamily serine protease